MLPWAGGWSSATCIDKDHHKTLKKTLQSGFNVNALKQFEPAVLRNLKRYLDRFGQQTADADGWSAAFDMKSWSCFTLS